MALSASSTYVEAPVDQVWETLERFGDISRWGLGVHQSSLLSPVTSGIGAVRRVQVGRTTLRETVTTWEPDHALGYQIEGLPPLVVEASNLWTLAGEGAGTRVTLTSEVHARGGRLASLVLVRVLARAGDGLLDGLAAHVGQASAA